MELTNSETFCFAATQMNHAVFLFLLFMLFSVHATVVWGCLVVVGCSSVGVLVIVFSAVVFRCCLCAGAWALVFSCLYGGVLARLRVFFFSELSSSLR